MNILGISDVTGNHSHSCVGVMQNDQLVFALSQERISRKKNDCRFPTEAIQAALDFTGLTLNDLDYFACGYPPAHYYQSLLHRSKFDLPRSFVSTVWCRPWQMVKYLLPNMRKALFDAKATNGLFALGIPQKKFIFIDHHFSDDVSAAYYSSCFDDCLAISYGGFAPHLSGQNVAGAVYMCEGDHITFLQDIPLYATGCYFSGVTVALGFNYMQQEGKTMGLASHGDPEICYDKVRALTPLFDKGQWIAYPYWIDYVMSPRADVYLGSKSGRKWRSLISQHGRENVAAAVQKVWEENIVSFVSYMMSTYQKRKLILSGGTFLNGRVNRTLLDLPTVDEIYIHPHTGDGSTTIGAMTETMRAFRSPARIPLEDVGLGLEYSEQSIEKAIQNSGGGFSCHKETDVSRYAAEQIARHKVVGWFQGREEYGPRSLGHRCILGHPGIADMKHKITRRVKKREDFIPLSPSVLAEKGAEYFKDFLPSPFMTFIYKAADAKKDRIPAALHVDGTARAQAVTSSSYKPFRKLLEYFYDITGIPMVLNTSFNFHGQPIVHEPLEAIKMFQETEMDELVISSFVLSKKHHEG